MIRAARRVLLWGWRAIEARGVIPCGQPVPLGLWAQGVRVSPATGPPEPVSGERIIEPWLDDPVPDYDTEPACRELAEPVMAYANG